MIRRGDVIDIAWVFARLEMKGLIANQHLIMLLIWLVISQLSVLGSHKTGVCSSRHLGIIRAPIWEVQFLE